MPEGIRPTQNKVRKALFDILGDIEGLSFLELFAGSGAVGLEALSRGAREAVFVEKEKKCIDILRGNLLLLGYQHYNLISSDSVKAIKQLRERDKEFDIIFLDPPYSEGAVRGQERPGGLEWPLEAQKNSLASTGIIAGVSSAKKTLQILGAYDILAPNGFLIVQHFKKDDLPAEVGDLKLFKHARYGDSALSFYKKRSK